MVGKAAAGKARPGIYRDDPDRDDAASTSSAVPLQSDIGADEDEEFPPAYVEDADAAPIRVIPQPENLDPKVEEWSHWSTFAYWTPWKKSVQRGSRYTRLSPTLTTDPEALRAYVEWRASQPPRAFIGVHGEHTETHDDGKKRTQETKVDFSVRFDVSETISAPIGIGNADWTRLVMAGPEQKTHRGTRLRKRHPRFKADAEEGPLTASLEERCHIFCASNSALKTFTMKYNVIGRNEALLQRRIESVIRGTNYRGRLSVQFALDPYSVTISTPHWLNRARNNWYIYYFCVITQLWIFTWPLLFFLTRYWSVVVVECPFQRLRGQPYQVVDERGERRLRQDIEWASESEERWAQKWKSTIEDGVMSRRTGSETVWFVPNDPEGRVTRDAAVERACGREPQEGFAGATMGLLRGIGNMVREDRNARGWGYDT